MKSFKHFIALLMLILLMNCGTTTKEEKTSPMQTVIEGLKNIQLPK